MKKEELLKRLELLPDDCEIKIKSDGKLYEPLESSWRYTMTEGEEIKVMDDLSNNIQSDIQSDINKTKEKATLYILTF